MPEVPASATTSGRVLAEEEADRVGVVDGDVGDHAAAGRGVVDPPALEVRRQVHRVEDPHAQHPADPAVGDEVADGEVRPGVAEVVVGGEDDALASAARTISAASAAVMASGFSQSTCLPAAMAARAWARCFSLVEET